jgi:hypothetical protein
MMKLESTQLKYTYSDASGYKFEVMAYKDEEFGWQAHVTMSTSGMAKGEDAIKHLKWAAKHFVRMIEEDERGEATDGNIQQETTQSQG